MASLPLMEVVQKLFDAAAAQFVWEIGRPRMPIEQLIKSRDAWVSSYRMAKHPASRQADRCNRRTSI